MTVVDAVVPGSELTLGLAEELRRLAPFGLGNPGVTLLLPGCELTDLPDGRGRQASPFPRSRAQASRRERHRVRARAAARPLRAEGAFDLVFRLEENRWNGTVAPQLVVRHIHETTSATRQLRAQLARRVGGRRGAWSAEARAIFEELGLEPGGTARVSLYESETFRALMTEEVVLARAARSL